MENYVVYVDNVGFFASMGNNRVTFTNEIDSAFQMSLYGAKDMVKSFENGGEVCCILKFIE